MERITVKNDEKEVILDFDTRFYPLNFIVSASKDFSECCWIFVDGSNAQNIKIGLKPKSDDIELQNLGYEFYNYVLGLIKSSGNVKEILGVCR